MNSSPNLADKLKSVRTLTDFGFALFPMRPGEKKPPAQGWIEIAQCDYENMREAIEQFPDINIGVATGALSQLIVLDIDPKNGGDESLANRIAVHGPLPPTLEVKTGGGGAHYYYRLRPGQICKGTVGTLGKGLDTRAERNLVVGPGSTHPNGNTYEIASLPPDNVIPYAPDWIILSEPRGDIADRKAPKQLTFEEGRRNNDLFVHACRLRRDGYDERYILASCNGINDAAPAPLPKGEVESIASSAMRYDPATVLGPSEHHFADGFAAENEGKIARIAEGGYAFYDNGTWALDPSGSAGLMCQEKVKNFVAKIEEQAREQARHMDREDGESLIKAVKRHRTAAAIAHIMKLAASDPRLLFPLSEFDAKPGLLNLKNGVLDLATGELLKHDPKFLFMKQADVELDRDAQCPLFDRFLDEILEPETAEFLMRAFAYALLGTADQQMMFILIGSGLNGKTTLTNVLRIMMGSYAVVMDPMSLVKKDGPSIGNDIARTCGARFLLTSEFPAGVPVDAPTLKRLTGNEVMTARFLFREHFEFTCTGVVFSVTNHAPVIDGGDFALRRRMAVATFNRRIAPDKVDPQLQAKLLGERSGIFNRLLQGLQRYREQGLKFPETVKAATEKYLDGSDIVGGFLRECCVLEAGHECGAQALYRAYQNYCEGLGMKSMSMPGLKRVLEQQKDLKAKRKEAGMVWLDLRLTTPTSTQGFSHPSIIKAVEEAQQALH